MEIGSKKCAILITKKNDNRERTEGTKPQNLESIRTKNKTEKKKKKEKRKNHRTWNGFLSLGKITGKITGRIGNQRAS